MCEYCNGNMKGLPVEDWCHFCLVRGKDKRWVIVYNTDMEDGYAFINYCPMCGRKLDEE